MKSARHTIAALTGAGLLLAAPAWSDAAAPDGKALFTKHCISCHGTDGRGNPNPDKAKSIGVDPELMNLGRAEAKSLTRDQLKAILLKGKEKMPAFEKKLKPDQVEPVLDYTEQLAEQIRKAQP
jgi:mono/diheme cytochrome c family protein